ncbi:MAG: DUF2141 domain-containing protein [Bacteroidetes bacterium]|nr:DUF2141 domain-containing protein [Bacteroidota bacterium]
MKVILLLLIFVQSIVFSQTLKVTISGLRNNKGTVLLNFYNTDDSFQKEHSLFVKKEPKSTAVNGVLTLTYTGLKPGEYGIVLLDDENNNEDMDFGWILPKEGYGFSNYYHTGMTKPHLSKFSFVIINDPVTVNIKVKYF